MSKLLDDIKAIIAHDGPITLERYMALALGHPTLGYYMTRDPLGPGGDFITAPEISQMFGEMLGVWIAQAWLTAGAPANARLVELGPGRGTLMADVLRAARVIPSFLPSVTVELVEISPALRAIQRKTLEGAPVPVSWRAQVEEVPDGPLFILANEFFDALPARHFVKSPEGWREQLVGEGTEGKLAFMLSPSVEPSLTVSAEDGAILEINAVGQRVMTHLAQRIATNGGALLVVDYGYTQTTLGESLQALANHAYVDPLADPGEADLTTHVDFAALARAARAQGAKTYGPVEQGAFLSRLGVERRAEALKKKATAQQSADIDAALRRLIGKGDVARHMGELFKVLAVLDDKAPPPPGFSIGGPGTP